MLWTMIKLRPPSFPFKLRVMTFSNLLWVPAVRSSYFMASVKDNARTVKILYVIDNRRYGALVEPSISFIERYGSTEATVTVTVSMGFRRWALNHALYRIMDSIGRRLEASDFSMIIYGYSYGYEPSAVSLKSCALRNHASNRHLSTGLTVRWLLWLCFGFSLFSCRFFWVTESGDGWDNGICVMLYIYEFYGLDSADLVFREGGIVMVWVLV